MRTGPSNLERLHPGREVGPVIILFTLVGFVGIAAMAEAAGVASLGLDQLDPQTKMVVLVLSCLLVLGGLLYLFRMMHQFGKWSREAWYSEQRFRSLFEMNPSGIFSMSLNGTILAANRSVIELTRRKYEKFVDSQVINHVARKERKEFQRRAMETGKGIPQDFETLWLDREGNEIIVSATMIPIRVNQKVAGIYVMIEDIGALKGKQQQISRKIKNNLQLINDMHYMVKRNLEMVSSLLEVQINYVENKEVKTNLQVSDFRLSAMARVHDRRYHMGTSSRLKMDAYVRDLMDSIYYNYDPSFSNYDVTLKLDPVELNINRAIPFSLLVNELIVNCFRYAFPNREKGKITVSLIESGGTVNLVVRDNGVGLPDFVMVDPENTLGMTLLEKLVSQLDGELSFRSVRGTEMTVSFPRKSDESKEKDLAIKL